MLSHDCNHILNLINKHEDLKYTLTKIELEKHELVQTINSLQQALNKEKIEKIIFKQYVKHLRTKIEKLKDLL